MTIQVSVPQEISSQPFTLSKYWQRCHWISIEDPRRYPDVASGHGESQAVVPQVKSLHMLQQDVDGVKVRLDSTRPRMWVWVGTEMVDLDH